MPSLIFGILPIVASFLILAAHFLRSADFVFVALCVLLPFLLFVSSAWVARTIQAALALGVLEWLRTLVLIVEERRAFGEPYTRAAIIIGVVAAFTAGSTFAFRLRTMRSRYRLEAERQTEKA